MSTEAITVGITAYRERDRGNYRWIVECIQAAAESPLVSHIVVVDDWPDDHEELVGVLRSLSVPKLYWVRNDVNVGVFGAKCRAVINAFTNWVLVADSDNTYEPSYFERLEKEQPWDERVWYSTSWGWPSLDYRHFVGDWRLGDVERLIASKHGWCVANTGNQLVHRQTFLEAFGRIPTYRFDLTQPDYFQAGDRSALHWRLAYDALDSMFLNRVWWVAGGTLRIVDGLMYRHRVDKVAPGNYIRSPVDKESIGPAYLLELRDAANGEQHQYVLKERRGRYFDFTRDDGAVVTVDFHAGKIL